MLCSIVRFCCCLVVLNGFAVFAPLKSEAPLEEVIVQNPMQVGAFIFPPRVYQTDNGYGGKDIELFDAIFADTGLKYELKVMPLARLYNQIKMGSIDLFIGVPNSDILKDTPILQGALPVHSTRLGIYGLKTPEVRTLEDLEGTSIITLRGFDYSGWLTQLQSVKNITIFEANNISHAMLLLQRSRAKHLFAYEAQARIVIDSHQIPDVNVTYIYQSDRHLMMRASFPHAKHILALLEQAFKCRALISYDQDSADGTARNCVKP